jgi:hypothetical protein
MSGREEAMRTGPGNRARQPALGTRSLIQFLIASMLLSCVKEEK